ncbi:MAG: glycogen/starch synthase [Candidatus Kapaibacterium sp.]
MAKTYKVLFVSSEVFPFAKESGIADVSQSLPLAIRDFKHDIRVMTPKYGTIRERRSKIHNISRLREVPIEVGDKTDIAFIKSSSVYSPKHKVQVYFSTNQDYFGERSGVYHDPRTWSEYPDNAERFIFFSKSILETCLRLKWIPDIVHCNDWQTALLPAYLRSNYSGKFSKTKILLTIHNFYRQGIFELSEFEKTGLDSKYLKPYIHDGKLNFLKGGIHYSNFITTVSPSYADEILTENEFGNGLHTALNDKRNSFKGILNGIETYTWNPMRDRMIHSRLSDDFEDYKIKNKVFLQRSVNLPVKIDTPLFGMIPRIGYQKGTQLLIDSAEELLKQDIQIILLGQGDPSHKSRLSEISEKHPNKFKVVFAFDEVLSHQIEAGADFFLMPSKYEPCGLNLMYSMKYGTVPVVRHTGGMKDSAKNYDDDTGEGNSIVFVDYDVKDFSAAILRAVNLYHNKTEFHRIIKNGMNSDFSWKVGAAEYDKIYRTIMKE